MFISLERLDMSGQLDWFLIPSQSAGLGVKSDLSAELGRCRAGYGNRGVAVPARSSWDISGVAPGPLTEVGLDCGSAWLAGLSLTLGHIRVS